MQAVSSGENQQCSMKWIVPRRSPAGSAWHDPDFGKGGNAFDCSMGDYTHQPNLCLGPIATAPFHAVKVNPGDATTTLGLVVDGRARVLDDAGLPIAGLYACGLDMNSLWRGVPPANGANNTLSLTFGYLAAHDIAGANTPAEHG